jgi:DNA replication protein DnaC
MQSPSKLTPAKPPPLQVDHQAQLEEYLRALKLPMFLHHYQIYAQDAARSGLSFERYLLALCEAEKTERDARRIKRAITQAHLPFVKEIENYDFSAIENLPKARILELAEGLYLDVAENLLLLGNPGLGKTHLAIGLALAACRQGRAVRFYRAAKLVDELAVMRKDLRLSYFMAQFVRLDLLVLDELGFLPIDQEGAQMLFQLISDLYERVSIIVTSNLRFADWNSIFGDAKMTDALIGRLTHKGHIIEFVGESYRFRHSLQQQQQSKEESKSEINL